MLDADTVFVIVAGPNPSVVRIGSVAGVVVPVDSGVGTKRAKLGLGAGINAQLGASEVAVAPVAVNVAIAVNVRSVGLALEQVTALDVDADVAADLQAGFSARDVVETRAVHVADAYIFHWLRLSDDNCVGRTSAGNCDQCRSGAEKQALNVHFLTSSLN